MSEKKYKFAEALARLNEIVTILENNDTELEEALKLYAEADKLTKLLEKQLKAFEQQITAIDTGSKEDA